MTWLTDAQVIALWADAANLDPDVLALLLESAYDDCVAYLPDMEIEPDPIPKSWMLAQAYQAKSRYNALLAGSDGSVGTPENGLTLFPLDWQVKQLLRPKRGRPTFG
ncbi:hypothetical protein [Promicromonospora sp. NPDC023987]|uniref:hypothetical protein n=1 Tax=Promicromonospora sp. NPDC023987 TaxID=3155360 RepID=UPI0033D5F9E4